MALQKKNAGMFDAYVNGLACRPTEMDRETMALVQRAIREVLPGTQVRWAGSQRKGTAVEGSDLDVVVESPSPVTESERRSVRTALASATGRETTVRSHAVRVAPANGHPKLDVSFANAAFGSRPLPDVSEYHNMPVRQSAARALKLWSRAGNLPHISGWVVEALVVHLDTPQRHESGLELFLRIIVWLDERATPMAVEGVLRPRAFPQWNDAWGNRLPGRLEALAGHARSLRKRTPQDMRFGSKSDVGQWLSG